MSLKTEATLVYGRRPHGWRYRNGPIVATCDTCGTSATATGQDHNGPILDGIYGLPGWQLTGPVLCPVHAPPVERETTEDGTTEATGEDGRDG